MIGGLHEPSERGFSNECHYYNMDDGPNGKWQAGPKMKYKRGDFAILITTPEEDELQAMSSMSISRGGQAAASSKNSEICVIGGLGTATEQSMSQGKPQDVCETLQVNAATGPKRSWTTIQGLSCGRGSGSFVKCGEYFYLIGGLVFTEGADMQNPDPELAGPSGKVERAKI